MAKLAENDRYFLHYAPAGDFEEGVFVPYATREDAERQAANDLFHGADPEEIVGIFGAPYELPKRGWLASQKERRDDLVLPHLVADQRVHVASVRDILKVAGKHQQAIHEEAQRGHQDYLLGMHEAVLANRQEAQPQGSVPGNAYTVMTGGLSLTNTPVALAAATAKTALYILAGSNNAFSPVELVLSFDGATSTATPVLVEIMYGTAATNSTPGTGSTAQTPKQVRGVTSASAHSAAYNCTSEPTVYEPVRKFYVTPFGGNYTIQYPLGREFTSQVASSTQGKMIAVRLTAPAIVNAHVGFEYEE
jgi:hypothetical protein